MAGRLFAPGTPGDAMDALMTLNDFQTQNERRVKKRRPALVEEI